jgi:hypothetical protein
MENQFRPKSVLSLALILLATVATITALNGQFASALEDHEITTVMVLPTTGGTTSVAPGNHSYANATELMVEAIPSSGYEFLYSNITRIMNTEGDHDMETDPNDMGHGGPLGELSDLDSLILTEKSVTITIDCAYTYQYQAFFAPSQNSSPTATSVISDQQQTLSADNTITYLAIGLVGGIAAVAAVVGISLKRKKTNQNSSVVASP